MSYGAILGQTPPQPEFKPIASDISYNPSSSQGVISGNNVQSALDQVAGYGKTTRDTANNALSLAQLFDGYEVDGFLEDYRLNVKISTLNTDVATKFSVPWKKQPTQIPELVLIFLGWRKDPARLVELKPECPLVLIGDKIKELSNNPEYNALVIGYEYSGAERTGTSSTPNFAKPLPLDDAFLKIGFTNGFYTQNQQVRRTDLESYSANATICSSDAGFAPITAIFDSSEYGQYRYGGFNWDLNNLYFHLHFPVVQYCNVPLNAWTFVKKKT